PVLCRARPRLRAARIRSAGMFVITNRKVQEGKTGLDPFGKVPNEKGNNELRLARVPRRARVGQ
ncbi:MAG: hypothetical protein ABR553_11540, partial [Gammaproteobacteria bacterium]